MTYSEEALAAISQLEKKYDIELVSIEHHTTWVERCERLEAQRADLLTACKAFVEYGDTRWRIEYCVPAMKDIFAQCRAAIAQAEEE